MSAVRIVGERARRVEDPALLRGAGRYTDDIELPGMLHAAFVRSPHAHALIKGIDAAAALAFPGVHAVYTGENLVKGLTRLRMPLGFPSTALPADITPYVLTPKEVCFVGEAVAMVVAESRYTAEDAASAVMVDYEPCRR
jgi:aerobic carbon-monoxide dehydrogenase large subunit